MYTEILISKENNESDNIGNIFGYQVNLKKENWKNHILKNSSDIKFANFLISKISNLNFESITILDSLYIEEEYQGLGYGKQLLNDFIDNKDHDIIILYADMVNSQKENFNLLNFYEKFGFEKAKNEQETYLLICDYCDLINVEDISLEETLLKEFNNQEQYSNKKFKIK